MICFAVKSTNANVDEKAKQYDFYLTRDVILHKEMMHRWTPVLYSAHKKSNTFNQDFLIQN